MDDLFLKKITRRAFLANTAKFCYWLGVSALVPSCATTEPRNIETKTAVIEPTQAVTDFEPAYLKLYRTGELKKRAEELWALLESCQLCPRQCRVNRLTECSINNVHVFFRSQGRSDA